MKSASLDIPDEFLCPITKELMKEPVIAAGKRTEDGLAIFIIWQRFSNEEYIFIKQAMYILFLSKENIFSFNYHHVDYIPRNQQK